MGPLRSGFFGANRVTIGGAIYYPDGAYRDCNACGLLADPPGDERLRWKNIVPYWQTKQRWRSQCRLV
jgi:hypothetical protein